MIERCIANLRTALADEAEPHPVAAMDGHELTRRLQEIADDRVRLRPGDAEGHRLLPLLYNLPNLRPGACAALLDHVLKHLDVSPLIDDACADGQIDCGEPLLEFDEDVAPDANPAAPAERAAPREATAAEGPRGEAPTFKRRPPDLFDKFLDMIAGVMGK